jgi:autotransporter-associated beta strand protein
MKIYNRTKNLMLGVALFGAALSVVNPARAVDLYQTRTIALGFNWNNTNIWGAALQYAAATTNYISGGTGAFNVRTHDAPTNNNSSGWSTFAGAKLTFTNSGVVGANAGSLVLKNGGGLAGMATANIELAGGTISYNTANQTAANGDWRAALGGTILVSRDSLINAISAVTANRDTLLLANLSGTGNLIVNYGLGGTLQTNALVLMGTNTSFSGNWTNTLGRIEIGNNALNPLGSGKVMLLTSSNALTLNASNDFTLPNLIEGLGIVVKQSSNTVTLSVANTFTGSTIVSNGVLKLANAAAISSSTNISLRGGTVDASSIGGLTLNAVNSQILNCRGSVTGNLSVDTANLLTFNMTSTTNDILNVSGSLTLSGTPTLFVAVPPFKSAGTYPLIKYTGAALSPGAFNLTTSATSQTYQLAYSAGQVSLVVVGVPKTLTWLGGSGDWDTSSLNWTNVGGLTSTNFATGDTVTFDDSASSFSVNVANATLLVIPAGMTVSNDLNSYTFFGDGISPTGTLTKKGPNTLIFTSPSNSINGPIDIQAGVLSVGSGGGFGALGAPTFITNNGTFRLNLSGGGIGVNAPMSGSGSVEVLGAASLTLSGSNSYTGSTTVNDGCQLFANSSNALGTAASGTHVLANGKLGFSTAGALLISEPLFVNGTGIASSPGALYAINGNTRVFFTAPVTVESNARFRMVSTPVSFTFSNTVSGTDVNLWCTPGNVAGETADFIAFENSVTLGAGGSFLKDGPGFVNLDSAVNTWGSTVISNGTLSVNNVLNGGTVSVLGGAVGGSGTVNGAVDVQAGGAIAPGNNGIGTLTLSSTLSYAVGGINLMQINRTNAQTADKLVAANIPLNGTVLSVVNTGPALQLGDSFDLFDGTITGPVPSIALTGTGFAQPNYVWDSSALLSSGVITVTTSSIPFLPLAATKFDVQPTTLGLTWSSFTNQSYTVQFSTNLASGVWNNIQANIAGAAGTNLTTLLLTTVVPATSSNYSLVQYAMGSANAQVQDAVKTMSAGALTAGTGVSLFNSTALVTPNYPAEPQLQVTAVNNGIDLASAIANQTWFTFTLTVGSGVTDLDLTSLSFNCGRGGASAPRGFGVYVTTPTTTDEEVVGATDVPTARPLYTAYNLNLAGLASLQNLTAGQVVTFKIPFYAPAAASSLEFDDLTVSGNVSPGIGAPYVGANPLFLRIKQQ